jgi:hypothetical protein
MEMLRVVCGWMFIPPADSAAGGIKYLRKSAGACG